MRSREYLFEHSIVQRPAISKCVVFKLRRKQLSDEDKGCRVIMGSQDQIEWKDVAQTPCGVKCRLSTTNMHSGASLTDGENVNSYLDMQLRLQDIEDMLLLLVQGKLTNLNVEERLALGVSLRMFTRSIILRRRVEDLQLGVKSYQKKLNLTRPDMYRSDLKRKSAYTTYSNPKGFIYHNKDKKYRLMRIDELHKFSDVWRNVDRERAGAMIQAIDQQLRNIRFDTSAGNPLKEILLKLNLPDHRILKDRHGGSIKVKEFQRSFCHSDTERLSQSDEVLKLKNFKKDAALKLFKCSRSHSRQAKQQAQDQTSMLNTSIHKLMIEVKKYELKTKVKA
ncbi:hypothetical protein Tco_0706560 [Tanacetum coccineum]|uniref:Uncharacterized protein n=1 Tax=Tanacetum coccineum TaxID=301880 RepID=A0ABQ4Y7Q3_9ASTR